MSAAFAGETARLYARYRRDLPAEQARTLAERLDLRADDVVVCDVLRTLGRHRHGDHGFGGGFHLSPVSHLGWDARRPAPVARRLPTGR